MISAARSVEAISDRELSLEQIARRALAGDPKTIAVSCEGRDFTRRWFADVAAQVEATLLSAHVGPEVPVCIIPRAQAEACAAFAGLIANRRTIFPIYSYQAPQALAREVDKLDVAAVIAHEADWSPAMIETARTRGMAGLSLDKQGVVSVVNGLEKARGAHLEAYDEPSVELLTSGTTGAPKRHRVTFAHLKSCIIDVDNGDGVPYDPDAPPTTVNVPLGNISGIYTFIVALARQQRILLAAKFRLEDWLAYIQRYKPVYSGLAPAAVKMLLDTDLIAADLYNLKYVTIGMGPVDPQVYEEFERRFGVTILVTYGATEFVGAATAMTPADLEKYGKQKFGSAGRPRAGVTLRVRDHDSGALLENSDAVGLLEVRIDAIGPDWIKTTDLARIDADGFLYLLGRADGVINRGGFKIHPLAIETALGQHCAVAAASVVGIPDARLGSVPVAAVELRDGAVVPSPQELEAHLRGLLPATNIPVAIKVVSALPRTPSLKVQLSAVRALFTEKQN